jgi:hypothetical protein
MQTHSRICFGALLIALDYFLAQKAVFVKNAPSGFDSVGRSNEKRPIGMTDGP